jgi:hypothetical protein
MEYEASGQEKPKRWMYRHSEKAPLNMSLGSPCFIHYTFFQAKSKIDGLGNTCPGYQDFRITGRRIRGVLQYVKHNSNFGFVT